MRFLRALSLTLLSAAGVAAAHLPSGSYANPVLFADYSDPDVIRDGNRFYLVASTFAFVPGIPILESPDLVHWTILGHVLPRLPWGPAYDLNGGNRYGAGVWAPALRKHAGRYYIYFPTPQEGIFMCSAPSMTGPWSAPVTLLAGPGWEDPCPFWDDDGRAYLIHSRKGAGPLILHRMSADGSRLLDAGRVIVRDPVALPNLEGPKFYKRNGYYYIFAPIAGVARGTQAVLRSKSIWGPYEHRVVLAQGSTDVNGPHQGGYIETPDGKGWFVHFQSRGAHGRIDWLEPVRWRDDWPIMGQPVPGQTWGQPVLQGPLPVRTDPPSDQRPQTSDRFNRPILGPQWEWNHNPQNAWWSLTERPGFLRLHAGPAHDLFTARNTLTQQMQDDAFRFTVHLDISGLQPGDRAGLTMFEKAASGVELQEDADGSRRLRYFHGPMLVEGPIVPGRFLTLSVKVSKDTAEYAYRLEPETALQRFGPRTRIAFSWWKGSRPGIFAYGTGGRMGGYLDVDTVAYVPEAAKPDPATEGRATDLRKPAAEPGQ